MDGLLVCEECGCVSGELGRGWVAYVCDDPEQIEPTTLIVYCPPCAASEFAHRPDAAHAYV